MPELLVNAIGLDDMSLNHFAAVLVRLIAAAALGAVVAHRPWRKLMGGLSPSIETTQAQTLIAVAGALMVVVIGDSTARAFGLVGLGGFIRFRSGIKDPRDAAVMFVMIGVGMACGLGMVPMAVVATLFAAGVLLIFDMKGTTRPKRMRVRLLVSEPHAGVIAVVREVYPRARVLEYPNSGSEKGKLVIELDAEESLDALTIGKALENAGALGIKDIAIEED